MAEVEGPKCFVKKTRAQLDEQVTWAEVWLGGQSLIPPGVSRNSLLGMDVSRLRSKFPERFSVYELFQTIKKRILVGDLPEGCDGLTKSLRIMNDLSFYLLRRSETSQNHQALMVEALHDAIESGRENIDFTIPSGAEPAAYMIELAHAVTGKVLVVGSSDTRISEIHRCFQVRAPELLVEQVSTIDSKTESKVSIIGALELKKDIQQPINVVKFYDMVLIDEKDSALSAETQEYLVNAFADTRIIRISNCDTSALKEEEISRHFNHNEAIECGALPATTVMLAKTSFDLQGHLYKNSGRPPRNDLDMLLKESTFPESLVHFYKDKFDGKRAIIFCGTKPFSSALARAFSKAGIPAASYNANRVPDAVHEEKFMSGEFQVLIAHDHDIQFLLRSKILADVGINIALHVDPKKAEERVDIITRYDPDNPFRQCTIVDFMYQYDPNGFRPILASNIVGVRPLIREAELSATGVMKPVEVGPIVEFLSDEKGINSALSDLNEMRNFEPRLSLAETSDAEPEAAIDSSQDLFEQPQENEGALEAPPQLTYVTNRWPEGYLPFYKLNQESGCVKWLQDLVLSHLRETAPELFEYAKYQSFKPIEFYHQEVLERLKRASEQRFIPLAAILRNLGIDGSGLEVLIKASARKHTFGPFIYLLGYRPSYYTVAEVLHLSSLFEPARSPLPGWVPIDEIELFVAMQQEEHWLQWHNHTASEFVHRASIAYAYMQEDVPLQQFTIHDDVGLERELVCGSPTFVQWMTDTLDRGSFNKLFS